jgi:hypothetical protein
MKQRLDLGQYFYFKTRIKYRFDTKCSSPFDRKSIKLSWSEIRQIFGGKNPGDIHTSVAAKKAINPKGHQTLLYFLFLGKGRLSRDYFYCVSDKQRF